MITNCYALVASCMILSMLISPEQGLAFLAAAMLITVSPGPDNLMVLSMGMSRGRKQGVVFGLGCALGCLSHTVLANGAFTVKQSDFGIKPFAVFGGALSVKDELELKFAISARR